MLNNYVFSWAENSEGEMVHVDSVPRGLQCNCVCPYCHERLMARHGDQREHGFAHHSDNRGANLEICYMVILYKLAEQIVQTHKRIHAPSYYGIFPEKDLEFETVKVDSRYDREDKQPDVIATTKDNKQYLIEFVFDYKVQHKKAIDYKNLNCIEIDLRNQKLETLEKFLLFSTEEKKWLNNYDDFNKIEERYAKANKKVRVVDKTECDKCELYNNCVAVMKGKLSYSPLVIENNGTTYRLCKTDLYSSNLQKRREEEKKKQERISIEYAAAEQAMVERRKRILKEQLSTVNVQDEHDSSEETLERSCFNCQTNLRWANRDGYACCGAWQSIGVPKKTPPNTAKTCRRYEKIVD